MMNVSMREEINKLCRPTSDRTTDVVLGILCLVFSLVASVGNMASLIYVKMNWNAVKKRRGNYTHQMTMILVVNIAATDLFNGMFSASFNAANLLRDGFPEPTPVIMTILCNFCGFVHFLTTRASILLMCCLSVFRYIAITKPTKFNNRNCKTALMSILLTLWVLVVLMSGLPYFFNTQYIYFHEVSHCWFHYWQLGSGLNDLCDYIKSAPASPQMFPFFCLFILPIHGPGLAMIVFTALIIARLLKLHFKLRQSNGLIRPSEDSLHAKAAVSTVIILLFFVMTYGLWWIISIIHFVDMNGGIQSTCKTGQFWRCKLGGKLFGYSMMISTNLMVYFNAAVNPFIYYYRLFQRSRAVNRKSVYTSKGTSAKDRISREIINGQTTQTCGATAPLNDTVTDEEELVQHPDQRPLTITYHVTTI